ESNCFCFLSSSNNFPLISSFDDSIRMLPTEAPSRPGYALTTLRVPSVLPNRICSYYKKRFCLATFTLDRTAEAIALHIHYYNTERIHTALGMSPAFAKKLK